MALMEKAAGTLIRRHPLVGIVEQLLYIRITGIRRMEVRIHLISSKLEAIRFMYMF